MRWEGPCEQSKLWILDFCPLHPVRRTQIHQNPAEQSQEEVTGSFAYRKQKGIPIAARRIGGAKSNLQSLGLALSLLHKSKNNNNNPATQGHSRQVATHRGENIMNSQRKTVPQQRFA